MLCLLLLPFVLYERLTLNDIEICVRKHPSIIQKKIVLKHNIYIFLNYNLRNNCGHSKLSLCCFNYEKLMITVCDLWLAKYLILCFSIHTITIRRDEKCWSSIKFVLNIYSNFYVRDKLHFMYAINNMYNNYLLDKINLIRLFL